MNRNDGRSISVNELKQTTIDNQIEKSATLSMLIADKNSHHQTNAKFFLQKDHQKAKITRIHLPPRPAFFAKKPCQAPKTCFLSCAFTGQNGHNGCTEPNYIMSENTVNLADYKQHEKDTGSAQYQIALMTQRIAHLTGHLGLHKKDNSSRRGLLKLVAQRRKLLNYLKASSEESYQKIIASLGLRR
jgi:small subunit ribosomal protein S15